MADPAGGLCDQPAELGIAGRGERADAGELGRRGLGTRAPLELGERRTSARSRPRCRPRGARPIRLARMPTREQRPGQQHRRRGAVADLVAGPPGDLAQRPHAEVGERIGKLDLLGDRIAVA